jgi:hypothetical protein
MMTEQANKETYLINAFSVNQLAQFPIQVHFEEITIDQAKMILSQGYISAVGHEQTALLYEKQLGFEIPWQRIHIALSPGSSAVLGQYRGPRLTEAATSLPDNAHIQWYKVVIKSQE